MIDTIIPYMVIDSSQVLRYSDSQVLRYSDSQVLRFADPQVLRFAGSQILSLLSLGYTVCMNLMLIKVGESEKL